MRYQQILGNRHYRCSARGAGVEEVDESTARLASILIALAEPTRLQMMLLLNEQPMSTDDFTKCLQMHKNTSEYHVKTLRSCGLIESQRSGKTVKHHIVDETLNDAIDILHKISTH